jgi:hypothetical protein
MEKKERPFIVWVVIVLNLLLGIGALAGGACLILAPDGSIMHMPVSMMHGILFKDFLIPGILLFTFVGLFPTAVAYSLYARPAWRWPDVINPFKKLHWSWAASLAAGLICTLWITIEVEITGIGALHVIYFIWGWVIVFLSLLKPVREYCRLYR